MTRTLLVMTAFALAAPLFAQKLKVGDNVTAENESKWLTQNKPGWPLRDTVYVIHFAPLTVVDFGARLDLSGCDALTDLHGKYAGKDLKVIGILSTSPPRTDVKRDLDLERRQQESFLTAMTAQAKAPGFPFAWDAEQRLWTTYLGTEFSTEEEPFDGLGPSAYLHNSLTFVIDKKGKIAFSGKPGLAAYVAEKVFDGSWKGKADADAVNGAMHWLRKFYNEMSKKAAPDGKFDEQKAVKTFQGELPAFEKLFKDAPFLLSEPQATQMRLTVHVMAQSYEVPDEILTARIAAAKKRKSITLLKDLSYTFVGSPKTPDPKFAKLAAKYTDTYAGLLDVKEASTDKYARTEWYSLVVISFKHGNMTQAERYTKMLLDALPEKDRKGVEEAIQKQLKDAGVGK